MMQNQFRTASASPQRKAERDAAGTIQREWRTRRAFEDGPIGHSREEYRSMRSKDGKPARTTRSYEERDPSSRSIGPFGPPARKGVVPRQVGVVIEQMSDDDDSRMSMKDLEARIQMAGDSVERI